MAVSTVSKGSALKGAKKVVFFASKMIGNTVAETKRHKETARLLQLSGSKVLWSTRDVTTREVNGRNPLMTMAELISQADSVAVLSDEIGCQEVLHAISCAIALDKPITVINNDIGANTGKNWVEDQLVLLAGKTGTIRRRSEIQAGLNGR